MVYIDSLAQYDLKQDWPIYLALIGHSNAQEGKLLGACCGLHTVYPVGIFGRAILWEGMQGTVSSVIVVSKLSGLQGRTGEVVMLLACQSQKNVPAEAIGLLSILAAATSAAAQSHNPAIITPFQAWDPRTNLQQLLVFPNNKTLCIVPNLSPFGGSNISCL